MRPDPADPTSTDFREAVGTRLGAHLDTMAARLEPVSPILPVLVDVARDLTAGGKRLRPGFAYWGWIAAAGTDDVPEALLGAVSAFELLHVGVLIHDDVLDGSDTRHGRPAAHRQFEAWHRAGGGSGDAEAFGRAMAVLLGDQLIVWSGELATTAGLEPDAWHRAAPYWHAVRTEVNSGQVLDVCAQYGVGRDPGASAEQVATRVLEEKTSRYTVQRPVQFGAAAGGADEHAIDALGRFGLALGRAFQLRDDLLGVFGDETTTGKPAAGDLREGKRTVLVARALESSPDAAELQGLLGRADLTDPQIDRARGILVDSGAVESVEQTITRDYARALAELDAARITAPGRQALAELARMCVERDA
ncbi:polyprenyl synthetase family protein [Brooklawnia cerclae]|uniref:Geranylgeranyl diphosphate synthase type I n=1 Tax=Brooklawnia cerclae TaxID=349934 RepID=A0ABX0SGL3_9ACTN|nr:polyprenyl synthetase family protein [Brooklawnia cerclae]NIH57530.1 geranylgeranyl diphosphate synthase type I [Brooklawnia cerclae]